MGTWKVTPRKSIYNFFLIKVAEEKRDSQIFCVVDMHAITLPQNPQVLRSAPSLSWQLNTILILLNLVMNGETMMWFWSCRANVRTMTASLLACGLSPSKWPTNLLPKNNSWFVKSCFQPLPPKVHSLSTVDSSRTRWTLLDSRLSCLRSQVC